MGKIILGTDEVDKIYLGSQDVNKVYLGDVEVWSASNVRVPPWFPEGADPVAELYAYWGTDLSQYFVDVALILTDPLYTYVYFRCYCNVANGLKIGTPNGTQLFQYAPVANSRIAWREIAYTSAGAVGNHFTQSWTDYTLLSNNFVANEIYIIEQGSPYATEASGGAVIHVIPQ